MASQIHPKTMTVKQAAKYAGHLSEFQVKARCKEGLIDWGKDGPTWVVFTDSLDAYLEGLRAVPSGGAA